MSAYQSMSMLFQGYLFPCRVPDCHKRAALGLARGKVSKKLSELTSKPDRSSKERPAKD